VLENAGLRLIVSPESGGQIVALVDKSSGANLSTSVGLLRDSFAYTEDPGGASERRAHGRYGLFNRPYTAEWQSEQTNPAVKLQYDAPEIFPGGAHIEKRIQFESAGTLHVDYRVSLNASKDDGAGSSISPAQSFVAVNSFPAVAQVDHATLFCWHTESPPEDPKESAQPVQDKKVNLHCEDFSPNGKIIELPTDARRVEVHTAGHPPTALEWDCGKTCPQMKIEPKNFSALFRLQFPPLTPGADPAQYTLRIRTLGTP